LTSELKDDPFLYQEVTYDSDVCICFSGVLQEVESSFEYADLVELKEADVSFLNEPREEAAARVRNRFEQVMAFGCSEKVFRVFR
jgi:hypothetical protein